jgi:hypothetical protein
MMKMMTTWGVITFKPNIKDSIFCIKKLFKLSAASSTTNAAEPRCSDPSPLRKKHLVEDAKMTKKVPLHADGNRTVMISTGLSNK